MTHSPRADALFCGRLIITVNWDYLYAQQQGKLASVCLQWFSSIFETSVYFYSQGHKNWQSLAVSKEEGIIQNRSWKVTVNCMLSGKCKMISGINPR